MKTNRTIVIASNNAHKLAEIQRELGSDWKILTAQSVLPGINWNETGTTFIENARIKAKTLKQHTAHCVLADDSGLCVKALGGQPGVWSSSFGGIEGDHNANNKRLLEALAEVPSGHRQAYFQCVLVFLDEKGHEMVAEGRCEGEIAKTPHGAGGFGYDPLFILKKTQRTMASLSEDEKNQVSHRGVALRQLKLKLGGQG